MSMELSADVSSVDTSSKMTLSESTTSSTQPSVCRDYLRNVCKRGVHCRYWHPSSDVAISGVVFCHDFQNAGCRRIGCRFAHCTREEEELYRRTGQLPAAVLQTSYTDVPICKDYLKGECRRGAKCKYEHSAFSSTSGPSVADQMTADNSCKADSSFGSTGSAVKMRKTELTAESEMELVPLSDYRAVEDENRVLRRDIDELRRTVGVLVAANELLLEQNSRYRASGPPPHVPVVSQVIQAKPAGQHVMSAAASSNVTHIAIDGSNGLVVARQQSASAAPVATLHPCVTATAALHPMMTATARLHPIATATLHPVGTATLHQNVTATLHPVVTGPIVSASPVGVEQTPVSVAIGMPSHAIVPVTIAVAALPTGQVTSASSSTYVTYPIMSNGAHI